MEQWKPIPAFPRYEISDAGRVRAGQDLYKKKKGDLLALTERRDGYMYVNLFDEGKKVTVYVHSMVLRVFEGDKPGFQACHKDGDPRNNALSNLYWGTVKDNARDRNIHGRGYVGEKHHSSRLTKEAVLDIRKRYKQNCPVNGSTALAKEYGVRPASILRAATKQSWKHLNTQGGVLL